MNKKVISFLFFLFFFFIGMNTIYADCASDVGNKITLYNDYKAQLENVDCEDVSNEETVKLCNNVKMQKNLIVSELMKLNEKNAICDTWKSQVTQIIDENRDKCYKVFDDEFNNTIDNVIMLFYIVGPILLIVFGTIDYSKAVVGDERALKEANKKFFRRLIATILLFLSPIIVNVILSFNISNYYLSGNAYACDYDYTNFTKKWTITYVPRQRSNSRSRDDGRGVRVDGINFTTHYTNMIYKGGVLPIPFEEDNVVLTSYFGWRDLDGDGIKEDYHRGIDIVGKDSNGSSSVPVLAVADGIVTYSQYQGSCGYMVLINHNIDGVEFQTQYCHMSTTPLVNVGQEITAGTQIGIQGNTGNSFGTHLHFGIRDADGSNPRNGLPYLTGLETMPKQEKW